MNDSREVDTVKTLSESTSIPNFRPLEVIIVLKVKSQSQAFLTAITENKKWYHTCIHNPG